MRVGRLTFLLGSSAGLIGIGLTGCGRVEHAEEQGVLAPVASSGASGGVAAAAGARSLEAGMSSQTAEAAAGRASEIGGSPSLVFGGSSGSDDGPGSGGGAGETLESQEPRAPDGFHCGGSRDCEAGEVCMFCSGDYFCSPDPARDRAGYMAAAAHCDPGPETVPYDTFLLGSCDGPEDCAVGEYCVATRSPGKMRLQCLRQPATNVTDCSCLACFYEGPIGSTCILCREHADCAPGQICVGSAGLWNNDVRGCRTDTLP
jgi:hypothetical protein